MSIERNIERIADALELIAQKVSAQQPAAAVGEPEPVKRKKKPQAEDPTPNVAESEAPSVSESVTEESATAPSAAPSMSFVEVKEIFFEALGKIRDRVGLDKSRDIGGALLRKHCGSAVITRESLPIERYQALVDDIREEADKYGAR